MQDQAAGLRKIMGHARCLRALGVFGTDAAQTALACAYLAHALSARGTPVWVLDEARGPCNVVSCLGSVPNGTLDSALESDQSPGVALLEASSGLYCLLARGGLTWLASVPEMRWRRAVQTLAALPEQPDYLLLHAAAAQEASSLAVCAQDRLLVVPQGKQALTRAYALLKAVQRSLPTEGWHVLVIQATSPDAARATYTALESTAHRFLGISLNWLGSLQHALVPVPSARAGWGMPLAAPARQVLQAFHPLADHLANVQTPAGPCPPEEFWLKMWLYSRLIIETPPKREHDVQPI